MALTQAQIDLLKVMIKQSFRHDENFTVGGVVNLLNAAQQETAYDFLRTRLQAFFDDRIAVAQQRLTDLQSDKTTLPPRV